MRLLPRRDALPLAVVLTTLALAACGDEGSPGEAAPEPVLGDARFEEVRLPAEGVAGHPFPVHARVIADAEKHDVTVLLRLVRLDGADPGTADLAERSHDLRVWSAVIPRMEPGVVVELDEAVDLPGSLEAGDYAAVIEIDAVDFTAEDDALQGEEAADRENNRVVAPDAVHVTRPDAPDLQFETLDLVLHHFSLPAADDVHPAAELLAANLVVASKALPVAEAFTVVAELGIPDATGATAWFPLSIGAPDAAGAYVVGDSYTFVPREHELADGTTATAALVANRPAGIHLGFFPTPAARDVLAALAETTDCQVRVHLDRPGLVAEYLEDNNARVAWARFYPDGFDLGWFAPRELTRGTIEDDGPDDGQALTAAASPLAPGVAAPNLLVDAAKHDAFGNDHFRASYVLDAAASYAYSAAGASILEGEPFFLYDADGNAMSYSAPYVTPGSRPLLLVVRGQGGDFYQLAPFHLDGLVLSSCGAAGDDDGPLVLAPADDAPPGCTGFRLIPRAGQQLANGGQLDLQSATYLLAGPRDDGYAADRDTPGPQTRFTIRTPSGSELARHLRFTTDDGFGIRVLGNGYSVMKAKAVAALDLDVPEYNLFACRVEALDVTVYEQFTPYDTDSTGTVILYDQETELYSRSVTRSKRFLLGGVVPLTVKATVRAELGLRGQLTAGPDRRLKAGLGPYVDVTGSLNAEVNVAVAKGGVHGNVRFLKVTQLYNNSLVLTDDDHKRYEFGGDLILETLDGDVYIYASTVAGCGFLGTSKCSWKKTLLSWDGYTKQWGWPATVGADL